jgi:hypothetical protein
VYSPVCATTSFTAAGGGGVGDDAGRCCRTLPIHKTRSAILPCAPGGTFEHKLNSHGFRSHAKGPGASELKGPAREGNMPPAKAKTSSSNSNPSNMFEGLQQPLTVYGATSWKDLVSNVITAKKNGV